MSDMELLHSITPRKHSPAALFAFWVSVFFLPGVLIVGLIQTVAADHERQLRHAARGRLIQHIRLFERELDPAFYIESVTNRIIANLNKGTRKAPGTNFLSQAAPFLAAWQAETGTLPYMAVFGNEDLASISVSLSDNTRLRPPLRIVSAWFRGLAGMDRRTRLRRADPAGMTGVPFRTASKLMNEFLGLRTDIDASPGKAVPLFSTRRFGETIFVFLLLDTVSNQPDSPLSGGIILLVRERDISKHRLFRHAAALTSERGVTRRTVCRPRRVYSLTASWKPAGKGLAIECAAPLGLYDTHGRIDPLR
nr:hypothetical protein [Candidatus Ozemobacteraceae bacterium]